MKTPEQIAEEYVDKNSGGECSDDTGGLRNAFLAGYQAAKDQLQPQPFHAGADVYIIDANNPRPKPMPLSIAEHVQFADTGKVMNSSNNSNGWISVKERLPTDVDGVTQLWMRGHSLAELVLGCHAVMSEHNEKIEGVLDMNKPDGLWDLSDFTHWLPLPKPPEDK